MPMKLWALDETRGCTTKERESDKVINQQMNQKVHSHVLDNGLVLIDFDSA